MRRIIPTQKQKNMKEIYKVRILAAAGDCNPMGQLQFQKIVSHIIEIATWHANQLGVGFDRMSQFGAGWILSRIGVEMKKYPQANDWINFETWVSSFNRLFTERCFRMTADDGSLYGEARTIWMGLDYSTRRPADLTPVADSIRPAMEAPDIDPPLKLKPSVDAGSWNSESFRYRFTDLDINAHVTTTSYVRSSMNTHTLDDYRSNFISRFDMTFIHESQAESPLLLRWTSSGDSTDTLIEDAEGLVHNLCRFRLSPR